MAIDRADFADAVDDGFREDTAEKVYRLLEILREIETRRDTAGRFTLKGGTALNIFHLPDVPRLSVDIDLITTGFPEASPNSKDRATANSQIQDLLKRLGYRLNIDDSGTSGVVLWCHYKNALGSDDVIKVDLDFLNRQPLTDPIPLKGPKMFDAADLAFPAVPKPELLAQKLAAVSYRASARDLYDMHRMIGAGWHKVPRGPELYRAHCFLLDYDWGKLAYLTKLEVEYKPALLEDVLRGEQKAPTVEELRAEAKKNLHPSYTVAPAAVEAERKALLGGDLSAFARIAGESDATRAARLAKSPALAWRLEVARRAKARV